ncbi:hypothetical protein STRAU_4271 [Streptomyces aurantiacus JA 4570]|uniref:Uncharacterized protein n=1 Tax=Streptomyces aurantiacus JA 4570 TaxID=1286094 RepID=S3ZIZ8_9ACTN|nr:hypothetical protein STRAU_4271 [Streptomyces aurantiacus JA 4570]
MYRSIRVSKWSGNRAALTTSSRSSWRHAYVVTEGDTLRRHAKQRVFTGPQPPAAPERAAGQAVHPTSTAAASAQPQATVTPAPPCPQLCTSTPPPSGTSG